MGLVLLGSLRHLLSDAQHPASLFHTRLTNSKICLTDFQYVLPDDDADDGDNDDDEDGNGSAELDPCSLMHFVTSHSC